MKKVTLLSKRGGKNKGYLPRHQEGYIQSSGEILKKTARGKKGRGPGIKGADQLR